MIHNQLDIGSRIYGQSVYLSEIIPSWDNPNEKMETPIAKITYTKSTKLWKIFWMRGNLKCYHYEPEPFVLDISDFFDLVVEDNLNCFFDNYPSLS